MAFTFPEHVVAISLSIFLWDFRFLEHVSAYGILPFWRGSFPLSKHGLDDVCCWPYCFGTLLVLERHWRPFLRPASLLCHPLPDHTCEGMRSVACNGVSSRRNLGAVAAAVWSGGVDASPTELTGVKRVSCQGAVPAIQFSRSAISKIRC